MSLRDGLEAAMVVQRHREVAAFGCDGCDKLRALSVLIVGARGVGTECAKNLLAMGVRAVTIHDDGVVQPADVGSNCCLRDADVGRRRADVVVERLTELSAWSGTVHTSRQLALSQLHAAVGDGTHADEQRAALESQEVMALTEDVVGAHDVAVFTCTPRDELLRWNTWCRTRAVTSEDALGNVTSTPAPVKFVACDAMGAAAFMFTDFGPEFAFRDAKDGSPVVRYIRNITNAGHATVELFEDAHDEDRVPAEGTVVFSDVAGMLAMTSDAATNLGPNINESGRWKARVSTRPRPTPRRPNARVRDPSRLVIGDTTQLSPYMSGGFVTFVPEHRTKHHRPLSASLQLPFEDPSMPPIADFTRMFRSGHLHFALLAVWAYQAAHDGELPPMGDDAAADAVVATARAAYDACAMARRMFGAACSLPVDDADAEPLDEGVVRMCALFSATELPPVCTLMGGRCAYEVSRVCGTCGMPDFQWFHYDVFDSLPPLPRPMPPPARDGRHVYAVAVFGEAVLSRLHACRALVAGCGSSGVEAIKVLAQMGVGHITAVDMGRVDSQFGGSYLHAHPRWIGFGKADATAAAIRDMVSEVDVEAEELVVTQGAMSSRPEHVWTRPSFIVDTLYGRKSFAELADMCRVYHKPMFRLGTRVHAVSLSSTLPPHTPLPTFPDDANAIPMHFGPFSVSDTEEAVSFLLSELAPVLSLLHRGVPFRDELWGTRTSLNRLRAAEAVMDAILAGTWDACVSWAVLCLLKRCRDHPHELLKRWPPDLVQFNGRRFWSGKRRCPVPVERVDAENVHHFRFVCAGACLLAQAASIPVPNADERTSSVATIVAATPQPPLELQFEDEDPSSPVFDTELKQLLTALEEKRSTLPPVEPMDDQVHAPGLDDVLFAMKQHESHAPSPGASIAAGLLGMEVYKLAGGTALDSRKDTTTVLPHGMLMSTNVDEVKMVVESPCPIALATNVPYNGTAFSPWELVIVRKGDITLAQLLAHVNALWRTSIDFVECVELSQAGHGIPLYGGTAACAALDDSVRDALVKTYEPLQRRRFVQLLCTSNPTFDTAIVTPPVMFYLTPSPREEVLWALTHVQDAVARSRVPHTPTPTVAGGRGVELCRVLTARRMGRLRGAGRADVPGSWELVEPVGRDVLRFL